MLPGCRALVRSALLLTIPVIALAGCSGSSSSSSASSSAGKSGVTATGKFGEKPTLTIPQADPPASLVTELLSAGTGKKVVGGQLLVANYLGETWVPKDGKPNVFDNSYDRKAPSGFTIGAGRVIKGWDQGLVGQTLGSRVLLSIPAAQAYGATADPQNELAGQALVFVVDLVDALDRDVAATGTKSTRALPAGLPAVTSEPGKKPVITSVTGAKAGKAASALLLVGSGDPIDETKNLAVQLVQTDAATGKKSQQTWGTGPQLGPATQVLSVMPALKGQKVGSRGIAVVPATDSTPALIVIVDVVGQY
jgi:peptidylprolyl isomerase